MKPAPYSSCPLTNPCSGSRGKDALYRGSGRIVLLDYPSLNMKRSWSKGSIWKVAPPNVIGLMGNLFIRTILPQTSKTSSSWSTASDGDGVASVLMDALRLGFFACWLRYPFLL